MRARDFWALGMMVVGLAVASYGAASLRAPKPRPAIAGLVVADTLFVKGVWKSTDARNNPVAQYNIRWLRNGVEVASTSTTDTLIIRPFQRALPGDTARWYIEVVAIDVRGVPSGVGRSPTLVEVTPWTAPTTPGVQIDTIRMAQAMDSMVIYHMGQRMPKYGSGAAPFQFTFIGDTATFCVLGWWDGVAIPPPFKINLTNPEIPDKSMHALDIQDREHNCFLVTALVPTGIAGVRSVDEYRRATP